jgi:hypothetical protein
MADGFFLEKDGSSNAVTERRGSCRVFSLDHDHAVAVADEADAPSCNYPFSPSP